MKRPNRRHDKDDLSMPTRSESEDPLSNPVLVPRMREILFKMTLEFLDDMAKGDSDEAGDDEEYDGDEEEHGNAEDGEDEDCEEDWADSDEVEIAAEDLESFLSGGLGSGRDHTLETLESAFQALPARGDEPKDSPEAKEERLKRVSWCLLEILSFLADLKNRYAILWARARLAELREPPQEADPYEFFVNVDGENRKVTMPMEVDDEERKELDKLAAAMNQRSTNVARADDVTVKARRRERFMDNFLRVQGLENMDLEITDIRPFSRPRLGDPAFLGSLVAAVNAATAPWRGLISDTVEEIEAQGAKELARIDRKFPKYWGPEGAGAMICAVGALRLLSGVADDPRADRFPKEAFDPHACFGDGFPELERTSHLLDEKIRGGGDPHQDLDEVRPARQFFLSRFLEDTTHFPEDTAPLALLVLSAIAKEVDLDKRRREANSSSTTERLSRQIRLAAIAKRELTVEHKYGKATIMGNCELVAIEPGKKLTTRKRLLDLLNAAFEHADKTRTVTSMTPL